MALSHYFFLTSVDPVNPILSTPVWVAKRLPKAPLPVTTLNTPGGRPASAQISAKRSAVRRVNEAGLRTTVFPMAKAGQTYRERDKVRETKDFMVIST